jgi:hypothetical protein
MGLAKAVDRRNVDGLCVPDGLHTSLHDLGKISWHIRVATLLAGVDGRPVQNITSYSLFGMGQKSFFPVVMGNPRIRSIPQKSNKRLLQSVLNLPACLNPLALDRRQNHMVLMACPTAFNSQSTKNSQFYG